MHVAEHFVMSQRARQPQWALPPARRSLHLVSATRERQNLFFKTSWKSIFICASSRQPGPLTLILGSGLIRSELWATAAVPSSPGRTQTSHRSELTLAEFLQRPLTRASFLGKKREKRGKLPAGFGGHSVYLIVSVLGFLLSSLL